MIEPDSYRTIQQRSKGIFRDRGSKFIGHAFPVGSAEEIKQILTGLKKEYHDARHLPYAYLLGAAKKIFRANDDGEPPGTAGRPIIGQIQANDLSNILIVVVRYFGGTLLGVSGLRNAYRSAAAIAIREAKIISEVEQDLIEVQFPYSMMHEIMKIISIFKMRINEQEFGESCHIRAFIRKSQTGQVLDRLSGIQDTSAWKH
jgi:uncharacterized YigZ family protein